MRIFVSGTKYVKVSFGIAGIKNRMNTTMDSLPLSSKARNLSRYFVGTMSCTNGAPKR